MIISKTACAQWPRYSIISLWNCYLEYFVIHFLLQICLYTFIFFNKYMLSCVNNYKKVTKILFLYETRYSYYELIIYLIVYNWFIDYWVLILLWNHFALRYNNNNSIHSFLKVPRIYLCSGVRWKFRKGIKKSLSLEAKVEKKVICCKINCRPRRQWLTSIKRSSALHFMLFL